jgi:hypothetical protein
MGTQGLCIRAIGRGRAARRGRQTRVALLMSSLAVFPALAGCSSWSNPGVAASAPPPQTASAAATGQPVYPPPPGQPAYNAPRYAASATPVAAAAPSDADLAANAYPYPKQSLLDAFRGSTESAQPSVPHPPGTYTPANQPYSPPSGQQPANGAPAGPAPAAVAAAPASDTDSSGYPYPKRSLFDLFSNKPAGQ